MCFEGMCPSCDYQEHVRLETAEKYRERAERAEARTAALLAALETLANDYESMADNYVNSHLVQRARELRRHVDDIRHIISKHSIKE